MALRAAAVAVAVNSSLLPGIPVFLKTRHHVSLSNHTPISSPQFQTGTSRISIESKAYWVVVGNKYSTRAIQGATVDPVAPMKGEGDEEKSSQNWKVKMLYDGDCPLCMREVNMLKERDRRYEAVKFVDISSDEYSPEDNQGLDYETAMGRIHAILSDGTIVKDVEAFRKLYEAVGLGWVYAITKYEPVATIADSVYGVWAKYRLQITGRPPLEEVLEARKKKV